MLIDFYKIIHRQGLGNTRSPCKILNILQSDGGRGKGGVNFRIRIYQMPEYMSSFNNCLLLSSNQYISVILMIRTCMRRLFNLFLCGLCCSIFSIVDLHCLFGQHVCCPSIYELRLPLWYFFL
jgi:hypothetical protein